MTESKLENLIPSLRTESGWNRKFVSIRKEDMDLWKNWEEEKIIVSRPQGVTEDVLHAYYHNPTTHHKIMVRLGGKSLSGYPTNIEVYYPRHVKIIATGGAFGDERSYNQSPCSCPGCIDRRK